MFKFEEKSDQEVNYLVQPQGILARAEYNSSHGSMRFLFFSPNRRWD